MTLDGEEFAPTRLILVRHGESNVTVRRVIGGPRTCDGLSDLGRQQAQRLRDRLLATGELQATALFASAYPRAIETAEIIAPALKVPVTVEAGFGEHDPGPDCDGLTFGAFVERYGMPDWEGDPHAVTFPGGETVAEFQLRVGATVSRVVHEHAGGAIVVACHGGVVDAAFRALLRLPALGGFELQTSNTSITELVTTRRARWRLVRYNDAAHLDGLPAETPRDSSGA
jgi:probable phosphoglycerate mutase